MELECVVEFLASVVEVLLKGVDVCFSTFVPILEMKEVIFETFNVFFGEVK